MAQEEPRYERNPDFIFRKIVDELVLIPVRQDVADMDCIYTINPVGAFIWERLDRPTTLADLQEAIVEEYVVDRQTAAADLLELLQELEEAGAVRRV